jgi:peptidoglycan hydrolase-like protein with peptidoglycan-binding domain
MPVTIPRLAAEPEIQAAAENRPALKVGAGGNGVTILQQALIDLGYDMPISTHGGGALPDGIFGSETSQVVKRFQRDNALAADGVAGRLTFQKLEQALIADNNRRVAQMRLAIQLSDPIG